MPPFSKYEALNTEMMSTRKSTMNSSSSEPAIMSDNVTVVSNCSSCSFSSTSSIPEEDEEYYNEGGEQDQGDDMSSSGSSSSKLNAGALRHDDDDDDHHRTSAAKKSVRFAPIDHDETYEVEHHESYTDEEHAAYWYDEEEKKALREECVALIEYVAEQQEHEAVDFSSFLPNGHVFRGLECQTKKGSWIRYVVTQHAMEAVLEEQERQIRNNIYHNEPEDPQQLAALYRKFTAKPSRLAYEQGIQDAQAAKDIYMQDFLAQQKRRKQIQMLKAQAAAQALKKNHQALHKKRPSSLVLDKEVADKLQRLMVVSDGISA